MGQYWKLVNIDRRCKLLHSGGLKMGEFVMSSSAEQLVGLLRNYHWLEFKVSGYHLMAPKQRSPNCPLLRLPQEIIDMIASILKDDNLYLEIMSLSLTCSYFFRCLAPFYQRALRLDSGPWAGHRLIFVGDYAFGYPVGIGSDEETRQWEKLGNNQLYSLPRPTEGEGKHASRAPRFKKHSGTFVVQGRLLERTRHALGQGCARRDLFERLLTLLVTPPPGSTPESRAPVLRNLTTKEFVRDAALAESDYAYSLGEVVILHTQWTDDQSGLEGLRAHGEWAGHRFDISDMGHVTGDEWKDVSEESVQRLAAFTQTQKKNGRRVREFE